MVISMCNYRDILGTKSSIVVLKCFLNFYIIFSFTFILTAFALGVSADGLGGHSHAHAPMRHGREEAPVDAYAQPAYGGDLDSAASDVADPLAALQGSIPGVPGEDYPIYSEVPESGFACDGQVDGGYYADPEAECQVFHICTADGAGGLAKYSFLCPNGTLFNQNYFICDWWFNFDCSTAEELYSLNDEIAAERAALDEAASDVDNSYAAPSDAGYAAPDEAAPAEYGAARSARQRSFAGQGRRSQG